MTADELQRIATRLSNTGWVRHWLHWNYPVREPWMMAIQVLERRDRDGRTPRYGPVEVERLSSIGFMPVVTQAYLYVIERTNEDGTPFRSDL